MLQFLLRFGIKQHQFKLLETIYYSGCTCQWCGKPYEGTNKLYPVHLECIEQRKQIRLKTGYYK